MVRQIVLTRLPALRVTAGLAVLAALACAARAGEARLQLFFGKSDMPSDVRMVDGNAYVKVSDVAKALGMASARNGSTFRLTQSPIVSRLPGAGARVGTDITAGKWQFRVTGVQQVAQYMPRYGSEKEPIAPSNAGDRLVLVQCRLRNGTGGLQEVYFDSSMSGSTALTDSQQRGYVPLAYDSRNSDYSSNKIPAGTLHDFTIIFSVPEGAGLVGLTYTLEKGGLEKGPQFRVSLR